MLYKQIISTMVNNYAMKKETREPLIPVFLLCKPLYNFLYHFLWQIFNPSTYKSISLYILWGRKAALGMLCSQQSVGKKLKSN